MELNTFPQTCTFHWIHFWNEFIQICCSEPIYRSIDILLSKQNNWSTHTSPRNSLSSSWTLGWSQTVISNMRSLKSLRWMWEYRNVWFHFGSALFFTVFVLLLLLSLEECSMFKRVCTKLLYKFLPKISREKATKSLQIPFPPAYYSIFLHGMHFINSALPKMENATQVLQYKASVLINISWKKKKQKQKTFQILKKIKNNNVFLMPPIYTTIKKFKSLMLIMTFVF